VLTATPLSDAHDNLLIARHRMVAAVGVDN
jgi:hypothetical protein